MASKRQARLLREIECYCEGQTLLDALRDEHEHTEETLRTALQDAQSEVYEVMEKDSFRRYLHKWRAMDASRTPLLLNT